MIGKMKMTLATKRENWIFALVRTMRPNRWLRNLLLYAGFLFTLNTKWTLMSNAMWLYFIEASTACALFCLLSSSIYIINDWKDIDKDRHHPVKRNRPLASGTLQPAVALAAAAILITGSLVGSFALRPEFGLLALGYFLLQLGYSFSFKHMVILDVFIVAIGFVMRAVGGAVAIDVEISPWLYIVTLLGALFLSLGKRRHELLLLTGDAMRHRPSLQEYTPELLDQMITIVATATVMAYSLYTFTAPTLPANHAMMLTIPFVLYGVFRYLYIIHLKDSSGSPDEALTRDRPLLVTILLWAMTAGLILAFFRS